MAYYLSVKNFDNEYEHFEVPQEVYMYVHQLEGYINYPTKSKLKERYPGRFRKENKYVKNK